MGSRLIFIIQVAGSTVFFALVAIWYLAPRLARLPLMDALTALLLLHVTRTLGLTFLVPGVVDPDLPASFAKPAAYGDLIAAALALTSIVALRTRMPFAVLIVWIFSVEGIVDLLNAGVQGARIDLSTYDLGAGWFIFTVLVPALLVSHFMIVARLIRNDTSHRRRDRVDARVHQTESAL